MSDISKGSTPVPADRMPTSAKVGAILLGFLAALLLVNAVLGFLGLNGILDEFSEAASDRDATFDRDAARTQLTTLFSAGALVGVACAAAAILLARRNKIGRLLGIGCAAIQLTLGLFNAISVGGLLNYTLLLIVLTTAILFMLMRGQTADWLRGEPTA